MDDDWEELYGLKVFYNDADDDPDSDGFSNYDEYQNGTDPMNVDKEKSTWWIWLLIVFLILGLVAGSYFGYATYKTSGKKIKIIDDLTASFSRLWTQIKNSDLIKKINTALAPYFNQIKNLNLYKQIFPPRKNSPTQTKQAGQARQIKPQQIRAATTKQSKKQGGENILAALGRSQNQYKDASTKEMIDSIRSKRQGKRKESRSDLISSFGEEAQKSDNINPEKKAKKKELLSKVEESFSDENEKQEGDKQ